MKMPFALLGAGLLLIIHEPAFAAPESGFDVAMKSDRRSSGYGDFTVQLTMILENRGGDVSTRRLHMTSKEAAGDAEKVLIVFDEPLDVKGTALLTHETADDDLQWLYLPALGRVKRINSASKTSSFMGSEFSYEDLATNAVDEYTYGNAVEEGCGEYLCYRFERFPKNADSGYRKQVVWVDREEYRPMKVEFYDRKGELLKTLTFTAYTLYKESFWKAGETTMVNHQNGRKTILKWDDYAFGTGVDESVFHHRRLKFVN